MKSLILAVSLMLALGYIEEATTMGSVLDFQRQYQRETYALLFYDSEPQGGFWSKFKSVFEVQDPVRDTTNNIGEYCHLMKVDISKPSLKEARDVYAVPVTPYVQTYQSGQLVFEEKPTEKTEQKI